MLPLRSFHMGRPGRTAPGDVHSAVEQGPLLAGKTLAGSAGDAERLGRTGREKSGVARRRNRGGLPRRVPGELRDAAAAEGAQQHLSDAFE